MDVVRVWRDANGAFLDAFTCAPRATPEAWARACAQQAALMPKDATWQDMTFGQAQDALAAEPVRRRDDGFRAALARAATVDDLKAVLARRFGL